MQNKGQFYHKFTMLGNKWQLKQAEMLAIMVSALWHIMALAGHVSSLGALNSTELMLSANMLRKFWWYVNFHPQERLVMNLCKILVLSRLLPVPLHVDVTPRSPGVSSFLHVVLFLPLWCCLPLLTVSPLAAKRQDVPILLVAVVGAAPGRAPQT